MEKTYSLLIQYGNGSPVAAEIRAKNGPDAQDKALKQHPGARAVRITGVVAVHLPPVQKLPPPPKEHPLFTDVTTAQVERYVRQSPQEEKLAVCHELRSKGLTYKAIAKQLDIGETTVRTWIKNTKPF
jgi:hypothetical protein